MPACLLRYCKNHSKKIGKADGITFHRFLRVGEKKREAWIKFVQIDRDECTWLPTKHSVICSAHFREEDFRYTKTGRKFLLKCAVPCSFSSNPENVRTLSPSSFIGVDVSDSESIFDSPEIINLKAMLEKEKAAKLLLSKKVKKLKRQNTNLHKKNEELKEIIKTLTKNSNNDEQKQYFIPEIIIQVQEEV